MSKLKYYDGTDWKVVNGQIIGDTLPIGAIIPYGSSTVPSNWLVCDGSAVSRTTYADLFAIIGTSYGAGDGSTTFNLPNLKGRVPVGRDANDTDFDTIGETGGEKKHTLTENELPEINGGWTIHGQENGTEFYSAFGHGYGNTISNQYKSIGTSSSGANSLSSIGFGFGGSQSHNNLQPYQVVCYIIKAYQSAGVIAEVSNTSSNSQTDTYSCNFVNNMFDGSFSTTPTQGYIKYPDGTAICYGLYAPQGGITVAGSSGNSVSISLPITLVADKYIPTVTKYGGGNGYASLSENVSSFTATQFTVGLWNNSTNQSNLLGFTWHVVGRWK